MYFSGLDIIGAIRKEDNYEKCRNYWKYPKAKLKKENSELVSATTQLKLTAADGKKYMSDALDSDGVIKLAAEFPSNGSAEFIGWFTRSDDTIDGKSKQKAYALFDSSFIEAIEVGTAKDLQQIHAYLFGDYIILLGKSARLILQKAVLHLLPLCFYKIIYC